MFIKEIVPEPEITFHPAPTTVMIPTY